MIVQKIARTRAIIREQGITTIFVGQNAVAALRLADRVVILDTGPVVYDGTARKILDDVGAPGRISRDLSAADARHTTKERAPPVDGARPAD